jgi:hypothetical protein
VGIHLPQYGQVAGPDDIVAAARDAERSGSPMCGSATTSCTQPHVLWSEDPATFEGRFRSFADIRLLPKPDGRIPIWVGGGGEPAYRRAVRTGEGFQLIGVTPEEAAPVVARLRSERPEPEFTISLRTGWDPLGMDRNRIVEECAASSEAGVQHVVAAPWRRDHAKWREAMEVLAGLVI